MDNDSLEKIGKEASLCRRCSLYKQAHHAVPGAGNGRAEIVFVGEAPGFWEDKQGIPFVGRAGKLLDKALAAIKLAREDIFIANIIKHRPPDNRDPLPEEIKACSPFLRRQIAVIKPKIVVTLGRFALNFFIPGVYISQAHGKMQSISWFGLDLIVFPLYHPAAALRNGSIMAEFKKDFLAIPSFIKKIEEAENSRAEKPPEQASLF